MTFSWFGLAMLALLFAPNLFWASRKPQGYEESAAREDRRLRNLERLGQILSTVFALVSFGTASLFFLIPAVLLMVLYELWWVRYFQSGWTMEDLYGSYFGVPVAGATLPVAAFVFLAVYGKNIPLLLSVLILGVGHIGIHWNHRKELENNNNEAP